MRDSEQRKKSAEDRRLGQLLSQAAPSARLDWGAVQAEAEKRRRRRLAARSVFSLAAALLLVMGGWAFWQEFLVAEDVVVITDDVVGDDSGAASERDTPPTTVAISEDSSWEITQISDNPGMGMVPWLDGHYLAWRSHDGHDWEILVVNLPVVPVVRAPGQIVAVQPGHHAHSRVITDLRDLPARVLGDSDSGRWCCLLYTSDAADEED